MLEPSRFLSRCTHWYWSWRQTIRTWYFCATQSWETMGNGYNYLFTTIILMTDRQYMYHALCPLAVCTPRAADCVQRPADTIGWCDHTKQVWSRVSVNLRVIYEPHAILIWLIHSLAHSSAKNPLFHGCTMYGCTHVQIALWNINKDWRRWNEGVLTSDTLLRYSSVFDP